MAQTFCAFYPQTYTYPPTLTLLFHTPHHTSHTSLNRLLSFPHLNQHPSSTSPHLPHTSPIQLPPSHYTLSSTSSLKCDRLVILRTSNLKCATSNVRLPLCHSFHLTSQRVDHQAYTSQQIESTPHVHRRHRHLSKSIPKFSHAEMSLSIRTRPNTSHVSRSNLPVQATTPKTILATFCVLPPTTTPDESLHLQDHSTHCVHCKPSPTFRHRPCQNQANQTILHTFFLDCVRYSEWLSKSLHHL